MVIVICQCNKQRVAMLFTFVLNTSGPRRRISITTAETFSTGNVQGFISIFIIYTLRTKTTVYITKYGHINELYQILHEKNDTYQLHHDSETFLHRKRSHSFENTKQQRLE